MNIGFIGLGIMGSRMAANILKAGHDLQIYNRTRAKAENLLAEGALWADSPRALAPKVDILFTMLATPAAVEEVASGENGFLQAMAPGTLWVNCSTVDPDCASRMAGMAAERGVGYLDAPVAGTKGPAASGELIFFVGGEKEEVDRCRPCFDCLGKKTVHLGEAGRGSAMKMLFNLMLGSAMAAYSEALVLGEALGFSKDDIAATLLDAPVTAPFVKMKHALIAAGDYEEQFPLRWMRKDLHLAAATAYGNGVALPALNAVKELYGLAEKQGLGGKDFAAVYKLLTREGGSD